MPPDVRDVQSVLFTLTNLVLHIIPANNSVLHTLKNHV